MLAEAVPGALSVQGSDVAGLVRAVTASGSDEQRHTMLTSVVGVTLVTTNAPIAPATVPTFAPPLADFAELLGARVGSDTGEVANPAPAPRSIRTAPDPAPPAAHAPATRSRAVGALTALAAVILAAAVTLRTTSAAHRVREPIPAIVHDTRAPVVAIAHDMHERGDAAVPASSPIAIEPAGIAPLAPVIAPVATHASAPAESQTPVAPRASVATHSPAFATPHVHEPVAHDEPRTHPATESRRATRHSSHTRPSRTHHAAVHNPRESFPIFDHAY
jgi:hypothetical protein